MKEELKPIADIENWSEEELRRQWKTRADLKAEMVGWLYPSILQGEMTRIQLRLSALSGTTSLSEES